MRLSGFLKDRAAFLTAHFLGVLLLCAYLALTGSITLARMEILLACWLLALSAGMAVSFIKRRRYFLRLQKMFVGLERKYLLPEVMGRPFRAEDRAWHALLRESSRSMMEEITRVRGERSEYKEYIESWVHEVKTPIAAIKLICENRKNDASRRVLAELERTENYVEQVLFYARSENVEKDYLIKELPLKAPVNAVLIRNKQLFIQNGVRVLAEGLETRVYSDEKWVEFIVNQVIVNAVKYRRGTEPRIRLSALEEASGAALEIWDNGVGISPDDLPRVFEKGFTGKNGRAEGKSTGIGLYLCRRLCGKLGLSIRAESVQGEYTKITLFFPKGKFVKLEGRP